MAGGRHRRADRGRKEGRAVRGARAGDPAQRQHVEADDQPLERVQWAMEQLSRGDLAGKVMVAP